MIITIQKIKKEKEDIEVRVAPAIAIGTEIEAGLAADPAIGETKLQKVIEEQVS